MSNSSLDKSLVTGGFSNANLNTSQSKKNITVDVALCIRNFEFVQYFLLLPTVSLLAIFYSSPPWRHLEVFSNTVITISLGNHVYKPAVCVAYSDPSYLLLLHSYSMHNNKTIYYLQYTIKTATLHSERYYWSTTLKILPILIITASSIILLHWSLW